MARFSNATEGLFYQEKWCFDDGMGNYCINYKDREDGMGFGCPVWDVHLFCDPGIPDWVAICWHLIPVIHGMNSKCIWHNKELVLHDEAINMTLDDWKELERGDIDVQPRFEFMADLKARE